MAVDPEIAKATDTIGKSFIIILLPIVIAIFTILGIAALVKIKKRPNSNLGDVCPKCGGALIGKDGKFGKFTGCSRYPKCDYSNNKRTH